MHHTWLNIMSCLCVECLPCVCFFPVVLLLVSSCFVAIVSIRSSTLGSSSPVRLLHGLILLPSGISGKMTVTLDLTTIISMLVASFYHFVVLPITCFFKPPKLPCQPLTFSPFLANHCLAMLPLCSAPLTALLVVGEVEDCSMLDRIMLGYHNISCLINAFIYLVKGGRLGLCLVFCSTLAALVSIIPVLCSRILRSLRGRVIYGTPLTVCFE